MKKLFLIICTLFSLNTFTKAQEGNTFGLTIGAAVPTGDFGSKDPNNEKAGFATTGVAFDLHFAYQFSKNFGLMAVARGAINGIDKDGLKNAYQLPTGSGGSLQIETSSYRKTAFLIGAFESVPLSKAANFFFEVKALAGLQRATIPEISVTAYIPGLGTFSDSQESINATSFAYLFGAGFKYKLSETIGLKLSGDFNGSKPNFKATDGNGTEQSYKQPFHTIDVGLGLDIRF